MHAHAPLDRHIDEKGIERGSMGGAWFVCMYAFACMGLYMRAHQGMCRRMKRQQRVERAQGRRRRHEMGQC